MDRITRFFMNRPVLFRSLMVGIVVAGVLAFLQMPKLEDPAVAVKQAVVVVPYPGAGAHKVELDVAQYMEEELRALPDVKHVTTECRNGMATFTVEFQMSVLMTQLEQHFDLLRRKVGDAARMLPQGCYEPIVIDDMMDVYGIFYAFTGEGYEYSELYDYAKYLRRELLAVKGVKRINIVGNRDEVIDITLSKEQIARNGLLPAQIMSSLQSSTKVVDAGRYAAGDDRIAIRVDSAVENEEELRNLLVSTPEGGRVRLGELARIERRYAEPQRNGFFVDGHPALAICIAMENDAIVPDVGRAVDRRLSEAMEHVPAGMRPVKVFFQPAKVDKAINSFMLNLVESVAIVILILVFTMGLRSGLIIGTGLVLTVAVSFPILLVCGTTLQRISLGAFIVAMGMLVDNAVVIMDGILVDKQRGLPPKTYLYRIGRNTAMPLLGATIIAVSTFVAVYLSPDTCGEYAGDLFLVLCVSLLASWVLALVQVPVFAKDWLPARPETDAKDGGEVMSSPAHRFVRRSVTFLIGHKSLTVATAVILLALSVAGLTRVKNLFFPDFDYDQFVVEYFLPEQSSPDRVRDDLMEMSALLGENPAIEFVAASMGSAPARYCLVRPMTAGGDCYGELIVGCKDYRTVEEQIPAVREMLRAKYPDAYIRLRKYNFSVATSHTVEVEFSGPDPAVLRDLSRQAEDIMRRCPYVDPYSVGNNWRPAGKGLVAEYVQQDALRSGLGRSDVGNSLLAATDGMTVGVLNDGDRMVLINLKVRNADGSRIADMNDIPVWSTFNIRPEEIDIQSLVAGGADDLKARMMRSVPLGNVVGDIGIEWQEQVVVREDGRRLIEAQCDPDPDIYEASPARVCAEIRDEIEAIELPEGYAMRWVGEGELQGEAIGNLMKYVPVTVFLILAILLMLFNSWKRVMLILVVLPFVVCGIAPALLLCRVPFTFMAIIGAMGLVGMMVKNAIVLVDEIERLQREEGVEPYRAVVDATVSRVRPVVMASATTIVGMIPLLGDPMYGSLAVTIMGGLTVGTIITLILLPLFYAVVFRVGKGSQTETC